MSRIIPIIIPAYEPDGDFPAFLERLIREMQSPVIVVDDGSGPAYAAVFGPVRRIAEESGGALLAHSRNRGKGAALKTAFRYVLEQMPDAAGVVTADSDGQHTPENIAAIQQELRNHPDTLILGVRDFSGQNGGGADIPWKSRFGNRLTEKLFRYISGAHITDTQTGLRGIPAALLPELLDVRGERFEYEMRMLLYCVGRCPVRQIPIETIYESKENHRTHFDPVLDSIRIYRIILGQFLKYMFSSLSSSLIDLGLFWIFSRMLRDGNPLYYAAWATVMARIISATYNYIVNYKVVFRSREGIADSAIRYVLLAVTQMFLSALLVTAGISLLPAAVPDLLVKIIVDTLLFFLSYYIQQKYVFHRLRGKAARK